MDTKETIKRLEGEYPRWQVWVVHRVYGGQVWCARLWSDERTVINAGSPDELAESIESHG